MPSGIGSGQSLVVGRGLIEILPDFSKWGKQLAADMRLAKTQMDGSAAGLKASALTTVGAMAKVGKATSLVGLGVGIAAVKMAGDFQAQTAVLQTAAGETASGLKVVRKGILSISENTGTGIKNLTDGMYTIEKAGFRGADGLKILKAAAQGAREENANLADVTNAMTSVMASYHLKANQSVMVMNAMKTAAGEGKITMEEFSGALSTVLPIASANKIGFEQVAGAMATLTQHGTSARESTHELAATIRALASPNQVASREMARFGLSSFDVSKNIGKRGLTGTIDLLVSTILNKMGPAGSHLQKTFEGTKQAGQDVQIMLKNMKGDTLDIAKQYLAGKISIGDWNKAMKGAAVDQRPMLSNFKTLVDRSKGFSRELKAGGPASQTFTDALKKMSGGAIGLNTILQLSGESQKGFQDRVDAVGKSLHHNTKDVEGWKITAGLLNTQMDRVKQTMKVMAIEIGTKLIPVVSALVGFLAKHKEILVGLVAAVLGFIAATTAAYIGMKLYAIYTTAATVATALWTVATMAETDSLMLMRAQLAILWVQESLVAMWTGITEAAFWGLAAAMLANPVTWIVVAIVALVAGIVLLATKTRFFQTIWSATWGFVKKVVSGFVDWLKKNWQLVVFTILTGGIGLAVAMIVRHWSGVKKIFSTVIDWIMKHWPLLLSILLGPITAAAYQIYKHWDSISKGAEGVYHAVIDWFVRMGTDIGHWFAKLPGIVGKFFSDLPGTLGKFFSGLWSTISDWFTKLPGRIAKTATGFSNALTSAGKDLIHGLFKGASDFFTKGVPDFFKMLWHGLVDFFKAVFGISSPSTVFASMGMDLIRGLFVGMVRIAKGANTWLTDHIYRPVINFFKNAGSWLQAHGRNLMGGLFTGFVRVTNTLSAWMTSHVYRPIVNFFRNGGAWLISQGRSLLNGFLNGIQNIARGISGWFSSHVKSPVVGFFKGAGSWLYQSGKNVIQGLWDGLTYIWNKVTSWVSGIAKWIKDHKGPVSLDRTLLTPAGKALMHGLLDGLKFGFGPVGDFVWHIGSSVTGTVSSILKSLGGAIGLGKAGPVSRFSTQIAMALRQLGQPVGLTGLVERRMAQESGGNPSIVNKWDSNWKAGTPSVGLMQVIGPTFRAYAGPYRNMGPFEYGVSINPMANIYAALNYALHRYGSLGALARPGGYDSGGIASGIGAMFKNTLQPERVLSPRQTAAFERLVMAIAPSGGHTGGGGGGGTVIERLVIENHGVIGSKLELENWLVTSLDTLRKKGRIK